MCGRRDYKSKCSIHDLAFAVFMNIIGKVQFQDIFFHVSKQQFPLKNKVCSIPYLHSITRLFAHCGAAKSYKLLMPRNKMPTALSFPRASWETGAKGIFVFVFVFELSIPIIRREGHDSWFVNS